jgi:hypothetical protein
MPSCQDCGKFVRTEQGLKSHTTRKHPILSRLPSAPQAPTTVPVLIPPPDPPDPTSVAVIAEPDSTLQPSGVVCSVCNRWFPSARSLKSHFPSHAVAANLARVAKFVTAPPVDTIAVSGARSLASECDKWYQKFDSILGSINQIDVFDYSWFDSTYDDFAKFLFEANSRLPGPVHPAVLCYRMRKRNADQRARPSFASSSNPQRVDRARRQHRREKYNYELAQYEYKNRRKRVARKVLRGKTDDGPCKIPMTELEAHFKGTFEVANDRMLEQYPACPGQDDIRITIEEVSAILKSISLDSSPGPDRILVRTVRDLGVAKIIKAILDIMLTTGYVPKGLSVGKTILISKGGDPALVANWRPITIYSVIRRTIEKILDKHLRDQISLNHNQRGFVAGVPGCHLNANLVNACLLKAKSQASDCTMVFLDVSKAFDGIGHAHIDRCLTAQGISSNMHRLIMALLRSNSVQLVAGQHRSEPIRIARSVPQGGPLSPTLFNMAINFVYEEICDPDFASNYGFELVPGFPALSLTGFADDQVVSSRSVDGARRLVELAEQLFQQIGLAINPKKSVAINILAGKLAPGTLQLSDGKEITCIDDSTTIKYLGCTFSGELVFDKSMVTKITDSLNSLISSPLLKHDQKLNILNQYLFPMLTYSLQAAPLRKIPMDVLEALDRSVRNTVKNIIGLPTSTTTEMMYSPRKYRGLGLIRFQWEVYLQHFAIALRLSTVPDELFHKVFSCQDEMHKCTMALGVNGDTTRLLRTRLRESTFESWCSMEYQGIGVKHFKTYPKSNKWICDKQNLSCSEWTAAVKLSTNYANLVGVPGATARAQSQSNRCRRCHNEKETIPHVLGSCYFGDSRRNHRHHEVKHSITALLRAKNYHCTEEVFCFDGKSNRFVDILAFAPDSNQAFIIDPTVRYETNEDRDEEVQADKERIYSKCYEDLAEKYKHFGQRQFETIGLWFGARGTISRQVVAFWERFGLDKSHLGTIAEQVLIDSIKIIQHHIYANV